MKKIILFVVVIAICCSTLKAQQISPLQKKAKTEIFNAVKNYGTNLIDEDSETIVFNYNDTKYRASVHLLNSQTLYLCLTVVFGLPESYNSAIANIAAFHAASNKPVCSVAIDGGLMFSCEMYAKEVRPFIRVLPEMLNALESSAIKFQEEYDKAASTYSQSTNINNTINVGQNEFIYPTVSSSGDSKLYIKKVTLGSDYTILDMVSYNGKKYEWCSISKNSYILANGRRYPIAQAEGIAYSPNYTVYPQCETGRDVSLHFKLYFPPLSKGVTEFDFSEGIADGWYIKGVKLKHGTSYSVNGESIETPYHKWSCLGIEVQDEQTIITKTVQPKSDGTYMYSSQDEYLEDADTGRKYYLINSSIGFEASPEVSYDTKPITFYEVYPALPTSVKRINISSGSQYYVKDLKIR